MGGLDIFALIVLLVLLVAIVVAWVVLAMLPGKMAKQRNHPQADAINVGGWLGALKDPAIREAIGLIHRRPSYQWTAEELAGAAGLSRSAFFSRFRRTVGETPTEYLTRWRIHLATKLLREEDCSVAAAGRQVGYATEAAFSNAFLRVMGVRPGAYRKAA